MVNSIKIEKSYASRCFFENSVIRHEQLKRQLSPIIDVYIVHCTVYIHCITIDVQIVHKKNSQFPKHNTLFRREREFPKG